MKNEDLYIGQKIYSLDINTPDFVLVESTIKQLKQLDDNSIEIYFESSKYINSSIYFKDGELLSKHFFFTIDEVEQKYRILLIEKLNKLENELRYLRTKNWKLLCK